VRRPFLWRLFRRGIRFQFDRLAPAWDTYLNPAGLAAWEEALSAIDSRPGRTLDIGTGTGRGAFALARRFPEAEIVGVDLSKGMLEEARRKTPDDLASRVRFEEADAERLPFANESFDLVTLANMIPFFDELDRVLAPGGWVLITFSAGPETPIYVPPERLRAELGRRGFENFAEFAAGNATALVARKAARG
jgi:demethylmenaquinone methyltransferase/2-methoxy-6-polyprenyl-1,4-benzoquinol methylase